MTLDKILQAQREFQELCEVNISTIVANDINALSEMYLFKAIEELAELRKTFPSVLNKWSKTQGQENRDEILAELCDVLLFLCNFCLVRRISPKEIYEKLQEVQDNNFKKLKKKKLDILNDSISRSPGTHPGIGGGNISPKLIFVALDPDDDFIKKGENHWHHSMMGKADYIKQALKHATDLDISIRDVYYTTLFREKLTQKMLTDTQLQYWLPTLLTELNIVSSGTTPTIIGIGIQVTKVLMGIDGLSIDTVIDPKIYMDRGLTPKDYYEGVLRPRLLRFKKEEFVKK